jgi:hypothetical protein
MENSSTSRLRVFRWYEEIGSKTDALDAIVEWIGFSRGVDTSHQKEAYEVVAQSCCRCRNREVKLITC